MGSYFDINFNSHGFVRSPDGTITTFGPPFCTGVGAGGPTSINDEGVITGYCISVSSGVSLSNIYYQADASPLCLFKESESF